MSSFTCLDGLLVRCGAGELFTTSGGHLKVNKQSRRFVRDVVVETFSTFTMMMCVCLVSAAGVSSTNPGTSGDVISVHHAAMASGLIVMTVVWVAGSTSGGILNPAITISAVIVGTMQPLRAVCYIIAQCSGSYAAVRLTLELIPSQPLNPDTFAQSMLCEGLKPWQGTVIEAILTFVLSMSVYATVDNCRPDLKGSGPLAVGLTVATTNLFGIPFTGASTNPARSFGPALASGNWINHWVYWVGPISGACIGGLLYEFFIRSTHEERALQDIEEMAGIDNEVMDVISEQQDTLSEINSVSGTIGEPRKSIALPAITIRRDSLMSRKKDSIVSAMRKQSIMSTRFTENASRKMSLPRAPTIAANHTMVTLPTPRSNIRKMSLPADDPNIVIASGDIAFA